MCTLSWLLNKNGYEIFFNRDEQRSRAKAIPPTLHENINVIMPVDPQGQGTWIGSNLHGSTLCLLNSYQKQAGMDANKEYKSRGKIIPQLLKSPDLSDIQNELSKLNLDDYLPFFLCVFPSDLNTDNDSVTKYHWDGSGLKLEPAVQPVTTSSVHPTDVIGSRTELFNDMFGLVDSVDSIEEHLKYHTSHTPEKGFLSVCVHREDAKTQSLCHISIGNKIIFRYKDDSPCGNGNWIKITQDNSSYSLA